MAEAALEVSGLTKSFGGLRVTRDVSLRVEPGEVHALIGPNGAGKTTLIAQIAGNLRPDGGSVRIFGREATGLDVAGRARLGMGRVYQISSVIGPFSVMDNVMLAALTRHSQGYGLWRPFAADSESREKARKALAATGLEGRADVIAAELSHGERRALELAMCLAQEPRLLLLDEPMAGAGREETARLGELLESLKGRVAMLLIEHDLGTVFRLADRMSVLAAGAIVATGDPAAVKADPQARAAYLGEEAA